MSKLKQLLSIFPEPLRDAYLNYKYNKQLADWERKGRPIPTPHIVKQLAIKRYQSSREVDTLVETGTYLGDMVYAQRKRFKKIYSIELSEPLSKMAQKRFKKNKNVEIIQGDSGIVLDSIINKIDQKAIFWLDGHYSGGITEKGSTECPIIQELRTILGSQIEHILLIDDAREFNGQNDYPPIDDVKSMIIEGGFPNSTMEVKDDIIRVELRK